MPRNANPWFRVYSAVLESPKVAELKPVVAWGWIHLLCLANVSEPRGAPPKVPHVAFRLRMKEKAVLSLLNELEQVDLVEETEAGWIMHDWEDWQYESENRSAAERRQKGNGSAAESPQNGTDSAANPPPRHRNRSR